MSAYGSFYCTRVVDTLVIFQTRQTVLRVTVPVNKQQQQALMFLIETLLYRVSQTA